MRRLTTIRSTGDTIVEVLLAITVFSMVAVGTLALMNQGVATSQRSLEAVLVKQQIDSQAEGLRAIHRAVEATNTSETRAEWNRVVANVGGYSFNVSDTGACPEANDGFVVNSRKASVDAAPNLNMNRLTAPPYSQLRYDADNNVTSADGIWIEASNAGNGGGDFRTAYDFIIKACWYAPGQEVPMTVSTNVRLYEP